MSLGNDRYVRVKESKGALRVDLREWKDDKPTKKGISLTLMRWKNWVDSLEYANQARAEKKPYMGHLGGNVYCTVLRAARKSGQKYETCIFGHFYRKSGATSWRYVHVNVMSHININKFKMVEQRLCS